MIAPLSRRCAATSPRSARAFPVGSAASDVSGGYIAATGRDFAGRRGTACFREEGRADRGGAQKPTDRGQDKRPQGAARSVGCFYWDFSAIRQCAALSAQRALRPTTLCRNCLFRTLPGPAMAERERFPASGQAASGPRAASGRSPSSPRRSPPPRRPAAASRARALGSATRSTLRPRPSRQRAGQPPADQPLASAPCQDPRRPPCGRSGAARRPPQLPPARGRHPGRGEGAGCSAPRPTMPTPRPSRSGAKTTAIISASSSRPRTPPEMADLKGFTRELVGQMEKDLGTKLDWVAVDHWNTAASARPHHRARRRRRRPGPRHLARLHQGGHARPRPGPGDAGAGAAHRSRHPPHARTPGRRRALDPARPAARPRCRSTRRHRPRARCRTSA